MGIDESRNYREAAKVNLFMLTKTIHAFEAVPDSHNPAPFHCH